MSRGVVIFAFNSEAIDYQSMAAWSAARIDRHLHLPTTLVTDTAPKSTVFDQVILTTADSGGSRYFSDVGQTVTWYNGNRMDVYNLSPYVETLVLDADYVVASDQLSTVFDIAEDFVAPRWAYDVTAQQTFNDLNCFGSHHMPMAWATIMRFRRSVFVEQIFEIMRMVKEHWQHYRNLYGIHKSNYRNDHALSIALNILHGHQAAWPAVPWSLASVVPEHALTQTAPDTFRVDYVTADQRHRHVTLAGYDFHAMGKHHLGEIVASSR
jgi:hypothetical protein